MRKLTWDQVAVLKIMHKSKKQMTAQEIHKQISKRDKNFKKFRVENAMRSLRKRFAIQRNPLSPSYKITEIGSAILRRVMPIQKPMEMQI